MRRITWLSVSILILSLPLWPQMLSDTTYFTSFVANFLFSHNLHEVVPGRFFRSAEMSREDLEKVIQAKGIKTVIDLRLDEDFVDQSGKSEAQVIEETGGEYYHIPLSSSRANQGQALLQLLDLYQKVSTPVLVHCTSGTHRSGMASALWLLEKESAPIAVAKEQLSLRYGFFSYERKLKGLLQGEPTLDFVFSEYEKRYSESHQNVRDWLSENIHKFTPSEQANGNTPPALSETQPSTR